MLALCYFAANMTTSSSFHLKICIRSIFKISTSRFCFSTDTSMAPSSWAKHLQPPDSGINSSDTSSWNGSMNMGYGRSSCGNPRKIRYKLKRLLGYHLNRMLSGVCGDKGILNFRQPAIPQEKLQVWRAYANCTDLSGVCGDKGILNFRQPAIPQTVICLQRSIRFGKSWHDFPGS